MRDHLQLGHTIWLLSLTLTLTACDKIVTPPLVDASSAASALNTNADALIKENPTLLSRHAPFSKTMNIPLGYLTRFTVTSKEMLSIKGPSDERAVYEHNNKLTARWQAMYCTDALKVLMRKEKIALAAAQTVNENNTIQSTAMCMTAELKEAPAKESETTIKTAPFTATQICKAGLSVMYKRKTAIMKARMVDGFPQVTYTRPSDQEEKIYRCKLLSDRILTWDDSLTGARWYGNAPTDTRLAYWIEKDQLVIQYIVEGSANNEQSFSLRQITR